MTAELSSALPGRGGVVHWIDRGLSPLLGSMVSYPCLASSTVDASAYPGVCWDYAVFCLQRWAGWPASSFSSVGRLSFNIALTAVALAINLAGLKLASARGGATRRLLNCTLRDHEPTVPTSPSRLLAQYG